MRKAVKACVITMAILTAIYIGVIAYANSNSNGKSYRYLVYGAYRYESDTEPPVWYMPEELGIVQTNDFGKDNPVFVEIIVDIEKEPFPLQHEQPIFLYKDKFYMVSSGWVDPGLPEGFPWWPILVATALGVGWTIVGLIFIKWRMKK